MPRSWRGLRRLWAADRGRLEMPSGTASSPRSSRARSSIRLIDAKLSDPDLVALLNEKRAAGMTVEVFSAKQLGGLKSHGKIMLLDDQTVVVGSLALAALSLDFRREVAIVVSEPAAVERRQSTCSSPCSARRPSQAPTARDADRHRSGVSRARRVT